MKVDVANLHRGARAALIVSNATTRSESPWNPLLVDQMVQLSLERQIRLSHTEEATHDLNTPFSSRYPVAIAPRLCPPILSSPTISGASLGDGRSEPLEPLLPPARQISSVALTSCPFLYKSISGSAHSYYEDLVIASQISVP